MNFARVYSAQTSLLTANRVDVEVDITNGRTNFSIIGLPDKAIDEAKDRVSSSIKHSDFKSPKQKFQKVVVSLSPADLHKFGTSFDVPIALAYLKACNEIYFDSEKVLFVGELSLDGKLRPVKGILPIVLFAKENNFDQIFIPKQNCYEASLVSGLKIFGAENLTQIIDHLVGKTLIKSEPERKVDQTFNKSLIDFKEIRGNENAKRGMEIAAAGGHNIALFGPPGTGKTMLSKAFSGILPPLSYKQIIESSSIHSITGITNNVITNPPFRSPHHTSSYVSIVGGSKNLKPGEVTLAHNGVLFMDEFPEFERQVIDALRQPLEDRQITIARASGVRNFPANFIFIASMNPCPCGYFGTNLKTCSCSRNSIESYQKKISGPIVDRVDIWIEVAKIDYEKLISNKEESENSEKIKERIINARNKQIDRARKLNSELSVKEIKEFCKLNKEDKEILDSAAKKLNLSARSYHRTIKIARTIADLADENDINKSHILEALQFRSKNVYS